MVHHAVRDADRLAVVLGLKLLDVDFTTSKLRVHFLPGGVGKAVDDEEAIPAQIAGLQVFGDPNILIEGRRRFRLQHRRVCSSHGQAE